MTKTPILEACLDLDGESCSQYLLPAGARISSKVSECYILGLDVLSIPTSRLKLRLQNNSLADILHLGTFHI